MSAKTGQVVTPLFTTANPAIGSAVDADATPTGTLYLNGTANAAAVTVTNLAAGLYKAAVTMPTLAAGDRVSLSVAATVSGVTGKGIIWGDMGETATASDVKTVADAIAAKTVNLPASPAAVGSAMILTAGERTAIASAVSGLATTGGLNGDWARRGVVLAAGAAWENAATQECTVLLDAGVWKMWYTGGWASPAIGYATAPAVAGPWTKHAGNPVLSGYYRSHVMKVGATYHMFAAPSGDIQIDHLTSADGLTWTLSAASVIGRGAGGTWDSVHISNSCTWYEAARWDRVATWYTLYEGNDGVTTWKIGLATAADPDGPWTKYAANPVLGSGTFTACRPCVLQSAGLYYLWFHGGMPGGPSDVMRAVSDTLTSWIIDARPLLARSTDDEGVGQPYAQVCDPHVVVNGRTVCLFYTASPNGGVANSVIKLAVADLDASVTAAASAAIADAKLEDVKLKTDTIGGAGTIAWPYTLTVNGLPCADAAVWITSDEAGNNVVASGRTDDFGALVPVPHLDAGTYYFWAKKSGVNFTVDIEVVA